MCDRQHNAVEADKRPLVKISWKDLTEPAPTEGLDGTEKWSMLYGVGDIFDTANYLSFLFEFVEILTELGCAGDAREWGVVALCGLMKVV